MKCYKKIKKFISTIFLIIIFLFWVYYIIKYANNILDVIENINWLWFFLAFIIFIPTFGIEILNWKSLLKMSKAKISFYNAGKSWLLSNLAKYVPGTIWIPLSRSYLIKQSNISYVKAIVAWLFELYFHLASSAFLFCLYFLFLSKNTGESIILFTICCLLTLIPLLKNYLFGFLNVVVTKIFFLKRYIHKFKNIKAYIKSISSKMLFLLFFRTMPIWIIGGVWIFILTYSVIGQSLSVLQFIYIWSFSWFIGQIIIFVPGGLGVREGVMVNLLNNIGIAVPSAMLIALLSRFQFVLLDGFITLTFLKFFKNKKENS